MLAVLFDALDILPPDDRDWAVENCFFSGSDRKASGQAIHRDDITGRHIVLLWPENIADVVTKQYGESGPWYYQLYALAHTILHEVGHLKFDHKVDLLLDESKEIESQRRSIREQHADEFVANRESIIENRLGSLFR
jgi:hypothetical protein